MFLLVLLLMRPSSCCPSPQGCGDTAGVMQAVLGLLLPLGYQYEPGLVLLVRPPGCQVKEALWQQLTCLLQGLALGHTLVLVQVS